MRPAAATLAALVGALSAAGCATHTDRIVLLPDAQGHVGRIMVFHGKDQTLLDSAYGTADVDNRGGAKASTLDAGEVRKEYAAEFAALPPRPVSYNLYFVGNSDALTPESKAEAPTILREIARRPAAEITVIGHTDTTADNDYNDRLSLARAEAVKAQLVELGFDPAKIATAGRGERELAVKTPDGVDEPLNRRAEISVR